MNMSEKFINMIIEEINKREKEENKTEESACECCFLEEIKDKLDDIIENGVAVCEEAVIIPKRLLDELVDCVFGEFDE